jgi:hypothetical protein
LTNIEASLAQRRFIRRERVFAYWALGPRVAARWSLTQVDAKPWDLDSVCKRTQLGPSHLALDLGKLYADLEPSDDHGPAPSPPKYGDLNQLGQTTLATAITKLGWSPLQTR